MRAQEARGGQTKKGEIKRRKKAKKKKRKKEREKRERGEQFLFFAVVCCRLYVWHEYMFVWPSVPSFLTSFTGRVFFI